MPNDTVQAQSVDPGLGLTKKSLDPAEVPSTYFYCSTREEAVYILYT